MELGSLGKRLLRTIGVLACVVMLTPLAFSSAAEDRTQLLPFPKAVRTLPPGFFANDIITDPDIWDPGAPGQCNVVYSTAPAAVMPYRIQGGGNPVVGEMNYLFYFPVENVVLGFIDPRPAHIYPKGVLHGKFGIAVNFSYQGGFPPGFAVLGAQDVLGGNVTYPVPGDKWSRVVDAKWPFIMRSPIIFDYPKHCRFNKDCYCLRKS